MPPPPHTKPENVLKRAQELVGVGQSQAALSLLHEHVTSKRTRNSPLASIEPVMLLFIELGVELKRGKSIKDGLYSYKNLSQNSSVQSLELVVTKYIELAEQKLAEAQAKAEEIQSTLEPTSDTANVDDLEATETPESILLSTVSGEVSKDRTDRAIVTPCLKFLWETYRSVLDILKNNARLEIMYGTVAQQAFNFCKKFERRTEFRRLCELLRNHLQNAAKYQSQIHAINLNDPDTLQRHLDTRFQQLSVGSSLELWAEAFRSVEDIHMLLNLTKRPARNITMATYFERLATIFSRSENHLFHAAAYNRYYNLLRASAHAVATGQGSKKDNPTVTDSDLSNCASFVILSALSIPVISTTRSRGALIDAADEQRKNKNQRLTSLLALSTPPTRASLLKEILKKGLLDRARPEIRELYNLLELSFHPLSICKKISPILSKIGSDPAMGKYVGPLQQVILTRLFQQLSQVYESVELDFVLGLAQFPEDFQVTRGTVEKFIMNGCKKGDLAIRIDHASGVLTFDSDVFSSAKALHPGANSGSADGEVGGVQTLQSTTSEIARSMLTRLAKTLFVTCQYVDPTFSEDQRKARAAALQRAEVGANKEHLETLERRPLIERKKQAASTALAQKEKEEATRKALRQQQQQAAETQRLENEQRERDQRRLREQQQKVQREEAEKQLSELKQGIKNLDLGDIDIDDLDTGRIRAMKLAALEKEKNELGERLRVTGKRIDHLERAMRLEQIKHLPADYEAQRKRDIEEYEETKANTLKDAEEKHKQDLALKRQLSRLVPTYEKFRATVRDQRAAEFEKRRKNAQRELEQKKQQRIKEFRERKAREQREREEAERAQREEEERQQREAEEEAAKLEEKKRRDAERRAEREETQRKADEVAAKQRQREEEALQRRKERTAIPERSAPSDRPTLERKPDSNESRGPPRLALAGNKPSWREREAMKASGQGPSETASAQPVAAPAAVSPEPAAASLASTGAAGKYVPRHLRNRDGPDGAPPPARGEAMNDGWRSSSQRGRDDNAAGGSKLNVPSRPRGFDRSSSRGDSVESRDVPNRTNPDRDGSTPQPELPPTAPGKYRPGAFRKREEHA